MDRFYSMTILFGVGDEVLITIVVGTLITLIAAYFTFKSNCSRQQINPDNFQTTGVPVRDYNVDSCPICLEIHRIPVTTNCGHKFCGSCLNNYLETSTRSLFTRASCPLCRQEVNILLLSAEQTQSNDTHNYISIQRMVHEYNVKYGGGPRTLSSYIRDFPVLFRHMIREFFTINGLVWMFRARIVGCFLIAIMYVFLPLDIIPETIFGLFGLLDDLIILFLCAIYVSIIYRRFVLNRGTIDNNDET